MLSSARRNWLVWLVVVPVVLWTAVRVLGLDSGFPVVALMAFTPYVAVGALIVLGLAVALENWVAATVAALATFCLAAAVLPRAIGDGTVEAAGRETIDVLSINAHFGGADPDATIALIERRRPDVLSVQELTPSMASKLDRRGIGDYLEHEVLSVAPGAPGTGIYSTFPLTRLDEGGSFGFRMPRAEAQLPDGGVLRIVAVHPLTPGRGGIGHWERALQHMPSAGRGAPWLLVGDFNATLDHSQLRDVLERGYDDAGAVAAEGLEPTWPAGRWADRAPGITIDHVLLDRRLDVVEYGVVEELPNSDHRPIHAVLALP